jgi:SPX domain protein involved in polyphosphate accumulation
MTQTPHHFNRYEIKYVVHRDVANRLKDDLQHYMHRDPHLSDAMPAYRVNSVYFDSKDFKSFWEKVNGVRFRRKVRIRTYGAAMPDQAFLEIKQKIDMTTQKRRNRYPTSDLIKRLVDGVGDPLQGEIGEEVELLFHEQDLEPKVLVSYDRVAYMGSTDDSLRVTFDSNCRYRQTDLFQAESTEPDKFFLHPSQQIVEIKFDNLIPRWLVSVLRKRALSPTRISKYCQSVNIAFFKAGAF